MRFGRLQTALICVMGLFISVASAVDRTQVDIDIPAQPLPAALRQLAKQVDVEIVYFTEIAAGRMTPPIRGLMTCEQALDAILKDTGLTFRQVNPRMIEIRQASESFESPVPPPPSAVRSGPTAPPSVVAASNAQIRAATEGVLQEIIVTATKREQNIDRVPISIVAFDASALSASGVKNFGDVAMLTPGIEFDNLGGAAGSTLTNVSIRGIDSQVGASTTGIYLDDTPIQSRINPVTDFGNPLPIAYDLARVEVARGPQGTLFGGGAEGGTIRFITPLPSLSTFTGSATAEYAQTMSGAPSYEGGAILDGPLIVNSVGGHLSAWFRRDGGYVDRLDPLTGATADANSNSSSSTNVRAALAIAVTDRLTIRPSFTYQSIYKNDVSTLFDYLSDTNHGDLRNGFLVQQPSRDTFVLPSLKAEAHLDFADFVSVTSYFHRNASILLDLTTLLGAVGLPGPNGWGDPRGPAYPTAYADVAAGPQGTKQDNVSQEIRLVSSDPSARISWVGGIFVSRATQTDFEYLSAASIPGPQPFLNGSITIRDLQTAAFGQADLKVTPKLTVTAGLRVARVKYDAVQFSNGPYFFGVPAVFTGSASETPVTPKGTVSYQLDDRNLIYATAAEGYRVGGINPPIPSYCTGTAPPSYASDKTWSYELGSKNTLADGRLHLDTSIFHINWRNIQQAVAIVSCASAYIDNAGSANINGFDFAASLLLSEHWKADLGVAYTDAYFTKTIMSQGVIFADKGASVGNVPQVPSPWSLTAAAEFHTGGIRGGKFSLRAEDIYHSKNPGPFTSLDPASVSYNPNIGANPATNLLNGRASLNWPSFDVSLFVYNALNSHPELMRAQDTPSSSLYYSTTFRPRTIGVRGEWRF